MFCIFIPCNIPMKPMLKILTILGIFVLTLLILLAIYFLMTFVLSRIAVKAEPRASHDITIYLLTNGVHADIVVPAKTDQKDWTKQIRYDYTRANDSSKTYLAFGWGDKGFYLDTPTWADLKFTTAFNAAFGLSTAAIHATYYHPLSENENCVKIRISKEQYARLIEFIDRSFKKDGSGNYQHIKTDAVYGDNDAFYEAIGSYHLFFTCNTWANNALKSCGQKASLWTPFDTGIFYHYKK